MVVAAGVAVAVSVAGVAVVAAAADYVENDLDVLTEVESKYPPNKFLWFRAQSYGLFPPLWVRLISILKNPDIRSYSDTIGNCFQDTSCSLKKLQILFQPKF